MAVEGKGLQGATPSNVQDFVKKIPECKTGNEAVVEKNEGEIADKDSGRALNEEDNYQKSKHSDFQKIDSEKFFKYMPLIASNNFNPENFCKKTSAAGDSPFSLFSDIADGLGLSDQDAVDQLYGEPVVVNRFYQAALDQAENPQANKAILTNSSKFTREYWETHPLGKIRGKDVVNAQVKAAENFIDVAKNEAIPLGSQVLDSPVPVSLIKSWIISLSMAGKSADEIKEMLFLEPLPATSQKAATHLNVYIGPKTDSTVLNEFIQVNKALKAQAQAYGILNKELKGFSHSLDSHTRSLETIKAERKQDETLAENRETTQAMHAQGNDMKWIFIVSGLLGGAGLVHSVFSNRRATAAGPTVVNNFNFGSAPTDVPGSGEGPGSRANSNVIDVDATEKTHTSKPSAKSGPARAAKGAAASGAKKAAGKAASAAARGAPIVGIIFGIAEFIWSTPALADGSHEVEAFRDFSKTLQPNQVGLMREITHEKYGFKLTNRYVIQRDEAGELVFARSSWSARDKNGEIISQSSLDGVLETLFKASMKTSGDSEIDYDEIQEEIRKFKDELKSQGFQLELKGSEIAPIYREDFQQIVQSEQDAVKARHKRINNMKLGGF